MPAKVLSVSLLGMHGQHVTIEADISQGLPAFSIVGLPDKAVDESRERVRLAIKNSKLYFPQGRITVNLAPADIMKKGAYYDMPLAVCILQASGQLKNADLNNIIFAGELSLEGEFRHIDGVIALASFAKENKITTLYVPEVNASEAALIPGLKVYGVKNLGELTRHLSRQVIIQPKERSVLSKTNKEYKFDFKDIVGQHHVKRALEIAASGFHNVLMIGPPGSGKTMLAKSMPSILPPLTIEESLEVTKIYSIAGLLERDNPLMYNRPFRSPHHGASATALVGGGTVPKPGEVTLAHRGVLFLDELTEFPRSVLDNLRQPIEDGIVTVARVAGTFAFPADFLLLGSCNPCPCGFYQNTKKQCTCTASQIMQYQKKLSGPLLDRIDLVVHVPVTDIDDLIARAPQESSSSVRLRVMNAQRIQHKRFLQDEIVTNSDIPSSRIEEWCTLDDQAHILLRSAMEKYDFSARVYYKIIKVARTIADLSLSDVIEAKHIAEAIQYRLRNVFV